MEERTLLVFSQFRASPGAGPKLLLTRKLYEGMVRYTELWGGPVKLVCQPTMLPSDDLDLMEVDPLSSPFTTICREFSDDLFRWLLVPGTLVLAGAGRELADLSLRCRRVGIPCVYTTEYSLRTRLEILRLYCRTFFHAQWHSLKERAFERVQVRSLSRASGIQCNGTPTYEAYRELTPRPLLFFDSRIDEELLAPPEALSARLQHFRRNRAIRLVFSGRLKRMKGVDHLPIVADQLRVLGVPFRMSIFGEGECLPYLRGELSRLALNDCVDLCGSVNFKTELIPRITSGADLFVCCHRQGDPSCTYLETMACGIPIVGYDNEAFRGISTFARAGWVTPMDRPKDLAKQIQILFEHADELEHASWESLAFARYHTFKQTFQRRIDHLREVADTFRPSAEESRGPLSEVGEPTPQRL